jgi:DNA-directed RNA polymerase subunit RPC12/RpoP
MKKCKQCNKELSEEMPLPPMAVVTCKKCNKKSGIRTNSLTDNKIVCTRCGHRNTPDEVFGSYWCDICLLYTVETIEKDKWEELFNQTDWKIPLSN